MKARTAIVDLLHIPDRSYFPYDGKNTIAMVKSKNLNIIFFFVICRYLNLVRSQLEISPVVTMLTFWTDVKHVKRIILELKVRNVQMVYCFL